MRNAVRIMMYEIQRNIRRRGYLFTTFGLPLILVLIGLFLTGISNSAGAPEIDPTNPEAALGVLDIDFGPLETVAIIDPSDRFTIEEGDRLVVYPDEATARAALEADEVDAVYILSDDYLESGDVRVVLPDISLEGITSGPIRQMLFNELSTTVDVATLIRLNDPAAINVVTLERADAVSEAETVVEADAGSTLGEDAGNFGTAILFMILFLFTVFSTSGYLMQSVIEEKENRLVEILLSSVNSVQLLVGKVMGLGTLGLLQIVVWIVIGVAAFFIGTEGFNLPLMPLLNQIVIPVDILPFLLAYFVLGYLFFAAVFGAVGAVSASLQEGPQYTIIFILPAMLPFYVLGAFLDAPNGATATFLSIFPITSPLGMILRLAMTDVPLWQLGLSLTLLMLTVVGMMWMAGRLFRVQTLTAGQTPGPLQLPRLIFGRS